MTQNIGAVLGKLAGKSIKQACNTGKSKPTQTRTTMYAKMGKKPMPQPAYVKQANPFGPMMASGALSTHVDDKPVPPKKKSKTMPANGPIRGTKLMRRS